jgi:hypothetical protein
MALYCRFCGLEKFRPSHFRFRPSDLGQLLILRLPVRCLNCEERTFASLYQFLKARGKYKVRDHEQRRSTA